MLWTVQSYLVPAEYDAGGAMAGDRLWLVWRENGETTPLLLGGGRLVATDDARILWTNATLPGVRNAAQQLGYGGPTNATFLHFTSVVSPAERLAIDIGRINPGLNIATPHQVETLSNLIEVN